MNMMFQPNHTAMQRAKGLGRLAVKLRGEETYIDKTCIDRRHEAGAAKLRFPKRSDGQFEAVLINTAGGLTGGDEMRWQFDVAAQCQATLTTQACEKIYSSSGGTAKVTTHITIGNDAKLAWLPQETILFDKSQLTRHLTVDLATDAEALFVEPVALGRLAMGESRITGMFQDRWRISQGGRLIHAEDFKIGPDISDVTLTLLSPVPFAATQVSAQAEIIAPDVVRPFPSRSAEEHAAVAGLRETHAFNLHLHAHSLMLKALTVFAFCAAVSVYAKAGVPMVDAALGPITLPLQSRFFTGTLGLLNVIFGILTIWYALRALELSRLSGLPFRKTASGWTVVGLSVGIIFFLILFAASVMLTFVDMISLFRFLIDNAFLHPDGYIDWRTSNLSKG